MWKFILLFAYALSIFLINDYLLFLVVFLINIFMMRFAKITLRQFINNIFSIVVFSLIIFFINLFYLPVSESLITSTKLFLVCNIVYIFSKILTPLQLVEAIDRILSSTKLGVSRSSELGILICTSIAFIPIFKQEMKQVLYSMKAKGVNIGIKNIYLVIAPMLNLSLKRTNDMEMALKAKAYK